jgi:hypothetical protein
MSARDAKMPGFFDAAQHRPGYRTNNNNNNNTPLDDLLVGDTAKIDAYKSYETALTSAWRTPVKLGDTEEMEEDGDDDEIDCPTCQGSGAIGNNLCPACAGQGSVPAIVASNNQNNDRRTIQQKMQDHKLQMSSVYDAYAEEISQAWKAK